MDRQMDRPLIVLDTETATCHGPPHLLELGAVRVEGGEIVDHFNQLVRPQVPIDPDTTAIHGIVDADVAYAPEAREVLDAFREWAGEEWLAAHNARFDAGVLGFECARAGVAPPPAPMLDSLVLARRNLPEAPDHKLATLTDLLEVEVDQHHRALDDAVSCWKVIEACLARMGEKASAAELLVQSCRPGRPLTVPAAMPGPPTRTARRLRPLVAAAREGTQVILHYGEPSAPRARLEVLPRMLYQHRDRGYLEAECASSGLLKTYRLDRVHKVEAL